MKRENQTKTGWAFWLVKKHQNSYLSYLSFLKLKWPFMSHKFSDFFLPKLKKKMWNPKKVFHVVAFDLVRI